MLHLALAARARAALAPMLALRKITLREMRSWGPRRLLIYCGDYRCAHSVVIDADRWPDDARLSDLEPKFSMSGLRASRRRYPSGFLGGTN
jgi:hypothetical protein